MTSENRTEISLEDLEHHEVARRFIGGLNGYPESRDQVLSLLNDPENQERLINESMDHRPAFQGVVHIFEADPLVRIVLDAGRAGYRFRQAVGAVILVKMERLGWQSTRDSYPLEGTCDFKNSKRYIPAPDGGGVR